MQGVGFRYHTKMLADMIGINGTVQNKNDGSVYIEASGSAEDVDRFIDSLKNNNPPFSRIDSMEISENTNLPTLTSFRVVY